MEKNLLDPPKASALASQARSINLSFFQQPFINFLPSELITKRIFLRPTQFKNRSIMNTKTGKSEEFWGGKTKYNNKPNTDFSDTPPSPFPAVLISKVLHASTQNAETALELLPSDLCIETDCLSMACHLLWLNMQAVQVASMRVSRTWHAGVMILANPHISAGHPRDTCAHPKYNTGTCPFNASGKQIIQKHKIGFQSSTSIGLAATVAADPERTGTWFQGHCDVLPNSAAMWVLSTETKEPRMIVNSSRNFKLRPVVAHELLAYRTHALLLLAPSLHRMRDIGHVKWANTWHLYCAVERFVQSFVFNL